MLKRNYITIVFLQTMFVQICMLPKLSFGKATSNYAIKKLNTLSPFNILFKRTYSGFVTDELTGEQLIGVSITVYEKGASTVTNSTGILP